MKVLKSNLWTNIWYVSFHNIGGGHDLYICSNSNTTNLSYTNLGSSFRLPGYVYGQQNTKDFLAGSYNFKVLEMEVFQSI
jgi:hypothetical protein